MSDKEQLKEDIKLFKKKGASWSWIERRIKEIKPWMIKEFYSIKKEMVHG